MLYCYDDKQSRWGREVCSAAVKRGMQAQLINFGLASSHDPRLWKATPAPGFLFSRIDQFAPRHIPSKQFCSEVLQRFPQITGIQSERDIAHYERKDLQAQDFYRYMPLTWVIQEREIDAALSEAAYALTFLGMPIVSKSAFGSSSACVRLLRTKDEALAEVSKCFTTGLQIPKRGMQKGQVIWQEFLPNNDYVYRVVRIGKRWGWMLRVFNRPDAPFASGSGKYEPVTKLDGETLEAMCAADEFFGETRSRWCGIDLAYNQDAGKWQLLETTLAWNLRADGANKDCPVVDAQGELHPRGYMGAHQFELLLDEIEQGAF